MTRLDALREAASSPSCAPDPADGAVRAADALVGRRRARGRAHLHDARRRRRAGAFARAPRRRGAARRGHDPRRCAARRAVDAGADFLVTPDLDARVLAAMRRHRPPAMRGALTPTEVVRRRKLGADVVKLFPASLGGPAYLKSLRGPFPEVPFMPTGGVGAGDVPRLAGRRRDRGRRRRRAVPGALLAGGRFRRDRRRARAFLARGGMSRALEFVGVTTGGVVDHEIFPLWATRSGSPRRRARGRDLPLGAPPEAFREAIARIRDDEATLGALVTTHKLALLRRRARPVRRARRARRAARRGVVHLQARRPAARLREDPITAALRARRGSPAALRRGGDVLCLGAGGAGTAIVARPAGARRPAARRGHVDTDRSARALDARGRRTRRRRDARVDGPARASCSRRCRRGSLVVNATGMGKDRPGSPLCDARFPAGASSRGSSTTAASSTSCTRRARGRAAGRGRLAVLHPRLDRGDRGGLRAPDRRDDLDRL